MSEARHAIGESGEQLVSSSARRTTTTTAMEHDGYPPYDSGGVGPNSSSTTLPARRHTQFLDLTNGEGGERKNPRGSGSTTDVGTTGSGDVEEMEATTTAMGAGTNAVTVSISTSTSSKSNHSGNTNSTASVASTARTARRRVGGATIAASAGTGGGGGGGGGGGSSVGGGLIVFDPNTPGKVVEAGQEHTGRWTKEEHEAFLSALKRYGKEWKKVAAKVKTRTVVQTRTHAQKYFQKLHKAMESGKEDVTHVEMGVASEARKASSSTSISVSLPSTSNSAQKKQKQQQASSSRILSSIASTTKATRQTSVTSAAHLISNLSSSSGGAGSQTGSTSGVHPHGILKQPQQSQTLLQQQSVHHHSHPSQQPPTQPVTGGQSFPPTTASATTTATHGFSTVVSELPSSYTSSSFGASSGSGRFPAKGGGGPAVGAGSGGLFTMKIVAPEHDSAMKRGKFPEPSPAACGKRKLAEIAAARMLAGVAASSTGSGVGSSNSRVGVRGGDHLQQQRKIPSVLSGGGSIVAMQHDPDGTATPPPVGSMEENQKLDHQMPAPPSVMVKSADGVGSSSSTRPKTTSSLSLQIVNPDSLGVNYDNHKRRRGEDGSPVTPWEGELKALVSESKNNKLSPLKVDGKDLTMPSVPPMEISSGAGAVSSYLHPACGTSTSYGRSPLHKAICEMDMAKIEAELAVPSSSSSSPFAGASANSTSPFLKASIKNSRNNASVVQKLQKRDDAGFCPLHLACCLYTQKGADDGQRQKQLIKPVDIVRKLLAAGADVGIEDSKQNTALHWAARSGNTSIAELLLLKNSPRDAKNDRGESPLHWAMRAGRLGMEVVNVLLENGARPSILSQDFKRAIDVAADGFHDEEGSIVELKKLIGPRKRLSKEHRKLLKAAAEARREARANLLRSSVQSRTLVLHHPECLEHIPKSSSDWEAPGRVTTIMDRLQSSIEDSQSDHIYKHEISISKEFDRAKLDLLSRVHSTEYLSFVNDLSKDLERQQKAMNGDSPTALEEPGRTQKGIPPVVPFTPMVQRSMIKIAESSVKEGQHSDTSFSAGSLRAARRAAGAVQHAVDCVLVGRNRNAFCVVRPPGHHAGINGLLDGGESCGFCIFNNVAAGAMHAISDERLLCERCAIVDIDVHHGNGTEEIVRKCHDPGKLFFFSIHLYDNERKGKRETKAFHYKFYPGTGDEDDVALNIINVPITPLWKEKEQVAPVNIHNTRHRARQRNSQDNSLDGDSSEAGTPKASDAEMEISSNKGTSSGTASPTVANPTGSMAGRMAYRRAIQSRLLPALRAFNPDLILISAGFDASRGDVGNAKHEHGGKEKMGIDLDPEDYAWTTRKVLEIADICCQGRVVSVLEGGYGRTPPSSSNQDETQPLDKTIFGECAIRHLHAMIDPYDVEGRIRSSSTVSD